MRIHSNLIDKIFKQIQMLCVTTLVSQSALSNTESQTEWASRALDLQARIDLNAPLAETTWIGTHNSTSNTEDDSMLDYNHKYSIKNQLNLGIRELVFDVHWDASALRVCHNNITQYGECITNITGDRKLYRALDDIIEWLNDDHKDQVILLKLEFGADVKNNINKLEKKLEGRLGNYLYRPDHTDYLGNYGSKSCTELATATLTKAHVLAAGKNIVTFTSNNCINDNSFNETTFYAQDNVVDDVSSINQVADWSDSKQGAKMSRVKDGTTRSGILGGSSAKMHPSNVMDFMRAGLNIVETYGYGGNDAWRVDGEKPVGPADVVWSWSETGYHPQENHTCATVLASNNRIASNDCTGSRHAACRLATPAGTYRWSFTPTPVSQNNADASCKNDIIGNYHFAAPKNAKDMNALNNARIKAGFSSEDIWIDYQKINNVWTADIQQ